MANLKIRDINGNSVTISPTKTVNVGGSEYIIDSNHNLWVRGDNRYGILGAGLSVKEINNANSAAIIAEQNAKKEELKNNLKVLVNLACVQYNNAQSNNITYLSTISSYISAGNAYSTSINNAKTELDNIMNDNSASSNAILNSVQIGNTSKSYNNWKTSASTYYTTQENAYNTLKNTYTTNANNLAKLSYDTVNNTGTNKKYVSTINTANTNCATYLTNLTTAVNSMAKYNNSITINSTVTYNSQAKTPANWKTYINNFYNTTLTEANNYKTNNIDAIGNKIATLANTIKTQTTANSPDSNAIKNNYTSMKANQTTYNNNINTYKNTYGYSVTNTTYTYKNSNLNLTKTVSDWVTWTGDLSFSKLTYTHIATTTECLNNRVLNKYFIGGKITFNQNILSQYTNIRFTVVTQTPTPIPGDINACLVYYTTSVPDYNVKTDYPFVINSNSMIFDIPASYFIGRSLYTDSSRDKIGVEVDYQESYSGYLSIEGSKYITQIIKNL